LNTLFSWLGQTDVNNMLDDNNAAISQIATKHPNPFDKILILASTWDEHWENYVKWLKCRMATIGRPDQAVMTLYLSTLIGLMMRLLKR